MAQMKEHIKTPEKELSDEERTNLSDAEFKILVIRKLTEIIKYGCKTEEKVKAVQSKIKRNIQGTNSVGKETWTQINDLKQKEEINIQLEQDEETRIQKKNEERLTHLWNNVKCANIQIIRVSEEEQEEQETENLFEQ